MVTYDLVVIGGGTAGCACAYTAGKLGLKTLILEKNTYLGGSITGALVLPVMKSGENQINTDFYNELVSRMKEIGGQITYQGNSGWFNPELLKIVLDKMMLDAGVNVVFEANITDININNNSVVGLYYDNNLSVYNDKIHTDKISNKKANILSVYIETKYIVDGTGDANFCKKINCDFLDNNNQFQPASLRFIMSGINLEEFGDWLLKVDADREVTTVEHINGEPHLSTAYTWDSNKYWALAPYFDDAVSKGILNDADRNYFQVFSIAGMPGSLAFNCPRSTKRLNPNRIDDRTTALIECRQAIYRIADFCKIYFPGFKNSYISNIADNLGVRVSNRVRGKYIYTIDNLKSGKKFNNPVLISNYPVDIHNSQKNASKLEKTGEYQLPIESLMSYNYDNLFVIGRCISADFESQAALRVQASCFSMGEAVAKYLKNQIN